MGKEGGMLVEISGRYVGGKDVSWVSKFPDEHETLFSRSAPLVVKKVTINGKVQTVVLD